VSEWAKTPKNGAYWFCMPGSLPDVVWIWKGRVLDCVSRRATLASDDAKHGSFYPIEPPPPLPGEAEIDWRQRALLAENKLESLEFRATE
jgi:hypothetical protein